MSSLEIPIPDCVSRTIPDTVKQHVGNPPSKAQLQSGLEALLDDFYYISLRTFGGGYPTADVSETPLTDYIDRLHSFVYYREVDLANVFVDGDINEFIEEEWSVDLATAVAGLHWLLSAIRYQDVTQAGIGMPIARHTLEAIAHFIQLASTNYRLEFATDGLYKPDQYLSDKLREQGLSDALFTGQEAAFIASASVQTISNETREGGMLQKVASRHVIHWSEFSNIPDYLNPRTGNEAGNKQSFITHASLTSWLARKPGFLPTQFGYKDQIPRYTDSRFFKETYLPHISTLGITDQELLKHLKINVTHLKWLKKGTRGMYFRQALAIDRYIFHKLTGKNTTACFPVFHYDFLAATQAP